jgi:Glycosyl hydrolase family 99
MTAHIAAVILLLTSAAAAQIRHPVPREDPARDLVRVGLRLVTDAPSASVLVGGALVAVGDGQRIAGPSGVAGTVDEQRLSLAGNAEGQSGSVMFRAVVAQVRPETTLTWQLALTGERRATIEVYNLNDAANARLVDRFEGRGGDQFTTAGAQLRVGGPLPSPAPPAQRLVLAFYFPWYERSTWSDPQLVNQPLRLYSTDDPADVLRQMQEAKQAGIDGVIVSFQGKDVGGGWNHRRMTLVLQAAQQAGLRVSVQIETLAAHLPDRPGPPHPDTLTAWLTDIVDLYGSHPAYLRVDGRPVVFLYVWHAVDPQTWRTTLTRVRASGRQLFALADDERASALRMADGTYTFAGSLFARDLGVYARNLGLAMRTWHLLSADHGPQRLGIVAVSPGYDETGLRDRPARLAFDRRGGELYDSQWSAAVESGVDWVVISSWNEWWENSEIEPSQRYGESYVWRTKFWSGAFRNIPRIDSTGR